MAQRDAERQKTRARPIFFFLARLTYGKILRFQYNMRIEKPEGVRRLGPPYIILANHVNTFDPILISTMYDKPIRWVAGDALFRNRVLRYLLRNLVGSISKSKSRSDYYTIREISRIVREERGIVGLFPEGQRTWDGTTLPLFFSTAKLVKMLKVPVVVCILEGGYHTLPRWSNRRRPGQLVLAFKDPIMPEVYAGKSAAEIYDILTEALKFDAHTYQKAHRIRYRGRRRAEYLEHVLYLCPECGSVVSIVSAKNELSCTVCGLNVEMDEYGFLSSTRDSFRFSTVAEWNRWQVEEAQRRIASGYWAEGKAIFSGDRALFAEGYRDTRLKYHGSAEIVMDINGLTLTLEDGTPRRFEYSTMDSVNVAFQRVFEFYVGNRLYRLKFPPPRSSAYKYLSMYESIMQAASAVQLAVEPEPVQQPV
jgi:1-acyl-sn-glycerol-3-phosphate acyltransferase